MDNYAILAEAVGNLDEKGALAAYLQDNAREFAGLPANPYRLEDFSEWSEWAGLDEDAETAVMGLAAKALADPPLSFTLFHCSRLVFDFQKLYWQGRD